jgi:hypothetical protein
MQTEHHLQGHFNTRTPDWESHVTSYGKHARVMATIPNHEGLYCRVDMVWGLREPTEKEVLKVAKHYGDAKGRWKLRSREAYFSNGLDRIDLYFDRA